MLESALASQEKLGVIDGVDQRQTQQNTRKKLLKRQLPSRERDRAILTKTQEKQRSRKNAR